MLNVEPGIFPFVSLQGGQITCAENLSDANNEDGGIGADVHAEMQVASGPGVPRPCFRIRLPRDCPPGGRLAETTNSASLANGS